jgi:hypothetical protein
MWDSMENSESELKIWGTKGKFGIGIKNLKYEGELQN